MNAETFCEHFATFADAPKGVEKLRELILDLAVHGKLVPQDPSEGTATLLLDAIRKATKTRYASGEIRLRSNSRSYEESNNDIPAGWSLVTLGEIADVNWGNTTLTKKSYCETGFTAFSATGPDGMIDHAAFSCLGIVLSAIGARSGKCFLAGGQWTAIKNTITIIPFPPVNNDWLFRTINREAAWKRRGGAQPFIALKDTISLPILLPPLAEQRRIVEKVDLLLGLCDELAARQAAQREKRQRLVGATLDRLVTSRRSEGRPFREGEAPAEPFVGRNVASQAARQEPRPPMNRPPGPDDEFLKDTHRLRNHFDRLFDTPTTIPQLRQTILQLAVQGQLVSQNPDDEPASALISTILERKQELLREGEIPKQSALPDLPEESLPFNVPTGWQWIRLESVCEIITKGSSPKWQGVQYVDASDGVLFVTSENVGNYVLRKMDEPKYVERKFNEMEPRSILQRDDILVNLVGGSIGRSALFDRDDVANINQAVGIIRLVRGDISIDRWYLLHYLNSPISLQIMLEEQVETARANLSLTNMKHFLVAIPPLAEQKRIVTKVTELLSLCDALEAKLTQADSASTQLLAAAVHAILGVSKL